MIYPYPVHIPLLQILCTTNEYSEIVQIKNFSGLQTYWAILPRYIYARCPFCQTKYLEPADTYSIRGWGGHGLHETLSATSHAQRIVNKRCNHFLGIQTFFNFNGQLPTEIKYFDNSSGEVPYITPQFFPDDMKTYAILHSLPVCKIVSEQFTPTYTVFILTYFSENPKEIMSRRMIEQAQWSEIDPEFRPATVHPAGFAGEESYRLESWADKGKLGWIDYLSPDLPLLLGNGAALPELYRTISGNRYPSIWRRPSP